MTADLQAFVSHFFVFPELEYWSIVLLMDSCLSHRWTVENQFPGSDQVYVTQLMMKTILTIQKTGNLSVLWNRVD